MYHLIPIDKYNYIYYNYRIGFIAPARALGEIGQAQQGGRYAYRCEDINLQEFAIKIKYQIHIIWYQSLIGSTGAASGAPTNCLIYYGGCSDCMVKTVGVFGGAYRNPPPTNVWGYTYVNPFVLVKVVICCGLLRLQFAFGKGGENIKAINIFEEIL